MNITRINVVKGCVKKWISRNLSPHVSVTPSAHDLDAAILGLPDAVFERLLVAAERLDLHVGKEVDDAVRGDGGLARLVQGGPRVPAMTLKLEDKGKE